MDQKTKDFIRKSKKIYGNKYDYSKTIYLNNSTKVTIICKDHGEFQQFPLNHFRQNCKKCNYDKKRHSFENFLERAKEIYGNRYDYSKANYIDSQTPITIICKDHGEFTKVPNRHLNKKSGCNQCLYKQISIDKTKPQEVFIQEAIEIHGDRYDYSKVNYINNITHITIICKEHGEFLQTPQCHLRGNDCLKCVKCYNYTSEEWIEKAKKIHENRYDYSKTIYINCVTRVTIICKEHGEFQQLPNDHLVYSGCLKCSDKYNYTTEEWIDKAIAIRGDKYDYSLVEYKTNKDDVKIICKEHGPFLQNASKHLNANYDCPRCMKKSYSKMALEWLNYLATTNNIYIRHAENEGELKIKGSNYRADGYCKKTNTIYEFNGCIFHGCPICYDKNDINPIIHKPNKLIYKRTLIKENYINSCGYKLIIIWEHDWKKYKNEAIDYFTMKDLINVNNYD